VPTAYQAYDTIAADEVAAFRAAAPTTDPTLNYMTQASVDALQLQGQVFGAMSLIGAALAGGGRMTQPERVLFSQVVGQQQLNVSAIFSLATSADRPLYVVAFGSAPMHQMEALENQVEASPPGRPIPVQPADFAVLSARVQAAVSRPLTGLNLVVGAQAGRLRNSLSLQLAVAAGLGLVAILVAAAVAIRSGNRLRSELTGLYNGAREMAGERLPRVIARLRSGDEVDVAAESRPLPTGRITEIARVADAFSTVQRTAVDAAVGQANLRKGVNQVFLNLSLRNQSLLHRQLGMLDSMERATNDPAALADLFRLDHLTTRMRRHAEGLIILGGAVPGRGWREPVPVLDVLRAAIAEVEDYTRVDVASETTDSVVGAAVNDVIHLLAELVENATSFSPPNTRVEIRADGVGVGFAVEVEDRGLGLTPEELAETNAQLARPPEFDLASSDQLGLFVVGQLAARHGIKVSLSDSPYGGTRAVVILPHSIIVAAGELPTADPGADQPAPAAAAAVTPFPSRGGPVANRERASAFSLTGRHRFDGAPSASPAGAPTPQDDPGLPPWGRLDSAGHEPGAAGTHLGLPRRVRQANLAPQLRSRPAQDPAADWPAASPLGRSPEETRSIISSLQNAWQRGRVDDVDYPGEEAAGWPGGWPGPVDGGDGRDT
jgi:signal transduction histidine kinase